MRRSRTRRQNDASARCASWPRSAALNPSSRRGQGSARRRKAATARNGQSLCASNSAAPPRSAVPAGTGGARVSSHASQVRAGGEHRGRRARRRCRRRRAGPRGDERRRDARVVVDALRMAEHHLGRRARKEIGDQTRVVLLARGRRPRHPALALPVEGQERVCSRGRRPRLGAETGDPEGIERQAGRLEQPEDPDRRRRRFRLEHRLGRESGEQRQRFPPRQPAGHHVEPGQCCQQVVPGPERLVHGAAPGSIAGPADGGQQRAPVVAPGARCRAATQPRPRQCRTAALRKRGVDGFEAAGERAGVDRFAAGLLPIVFHTRTAQPRRSVAGQKRRAREPRGPLEGQGRVGEGEEVQRRGHAGHVGQRGAERQVVGTRRRVPAGPLQRRAKDVVGQRRNLVAPRGKVDDHHADGRPRCGVAARARPAQRRGDFVACRGAADDGDRARRRRDRVDRVDADPGFAQRRARSQLLRGELDEAGQHDLRGNERGPRRCGADELVERARRVDRGLVAQRLRETVGPAGERSGILAHRRPIPAAPALAAGAVGMHALPRLDGEFGRAGHVGERCSRREVGSDHAAPEHRRLCRREEPRCGGRVPGRDGVAPQAGDERVPGKDPRRDPRSEPDGLLCRVVQRRQPAREAVVGRDHRRAAGERGSEARRHRR